MAKLSWTSIIGGLILLVTIYLIYHTFDESYQTSIQSAGRGPVFFPRIILGAMLLFSVIVIVEGLDKVREKISAKTLMVVLAVTAFAGLYIFSITVAGFIISTVVFTFVLPGLLGYRKWHIALAVAAIYPVAVWYIFDKFFLIILPSSPWFEAF